MAGGLSKDPVIGRQKARMPPSTIPPEQVRQIMAELQSGAAAQPAPEPRTPRAGSGRRAGMLAAFGLVVAGGVIGAAATAFMPGLHKPKPAVAAKPPAPAPTFMAATPVPAPVPVAPAPAPAGPAAAEPALRPALATVEPVKSVPAKPKSCVLGGPCTGADVRAAEKRLQGAYDSARKAGVPSSQLANVKQRWNKARLGAAGKPRTTVGAYRSLTSELNGKTVKARSRRR